MKKLFLISMLTIFAVTVLVAQERRGPSPEMFEKIKAEKISFFTSKLDLTPAEAQAFWPVYNEFEKKRFDIQRQIHQFERMPDEKITSLSETEIEKMTDNYIGSFEKEALLLKEYNKQFLKILPKKKVLMMYRTENEFRSHLIREYKRGQKPE
ncbi:MAG: hypothetical protein JZU47_21590 [Prolixibacteraceae bacterium]|jgi:hypothetical protein|nr:hypothetical protein [Prolixibacteraceae bacterium]